MSFLAIDDSQLSRLTQAIQDRVGHQRYQVWFSNSTRFDLKHDTLEINVPNDFISDWIGAHFSRTIQEAAHEVIGSPLAVRFNVMPQLFEGGRLKANPDAAAGAPQRDKYVAAARPAKASVSKALAFGVTASPMPASIDRDIAAPSHQGPRRDGAANQVTNQQPRLRQDLESFIVGSSNQLAFDAAKYVSEFPGAQYNPLFIHGACGLGKTHLLQGLCKKFINHHPSKKWAYLTGEEFTNEFLLALRNNRIESFRRKMRELDLLVIDDVHFLGGKKATQEEFLHTFNAIEAMGKQVVLVSDEHPKLISEFGESLINRFVSGMVVRIDTPNVAMRQQLLRAMSLKQRLVLSDEVIEWVAKRVTQNVRELEGAVCRIGAHIRLTGRVADISLAQEALGDLDRQLVAPVKPEHVLTGVCAYFGLDMKDLMSGRRQRTISLARSVAMYLIRKTSKLSFPEIAGKMGKRNHSTVISACRRIEKAASKNERLAWSSSVGDRDEEAVEMLQRLEEQARAASCCA
ncbi:MAG: Chromosomal replication initiator protein DnaA [Phycisphaerales bacterium]|nr:Chromosomal replication initiator protein DnaA [Phycisphaerales bacterium]